MTESEYIKFCISLDTNYANVSERLLDQKNLSLMHGALGIAGEAGEVADLIKKTLIANKPLDVKELKKELGDVCWYMAIVLNEIGSSFTEIMQLNKEKLMKRFPNGYSEQDAQAQRDQKC